MLILGIDTATPWGTMALCQDDRILFEVSLRKIKGGGEYLLALLEQFLIEIDQQIRDIQLIAVGTGPGSYTGIRVGLAAVAGLAEGLNIPVYPINTLKIIAENCRLASGWIAPNIDARRGEVYAALYRSVAGGMQEIRQPVAIDVKEFAKSLSDLTEIIVCGDGSKEYFNIWSGYTNVKIAPSYWDRPMGSMAAQIAMREWVPGTRQGELLKPSYLKRVEAEVRLEERKDGPQDRYLSNER